MSQQILPTRGVFRIIMVYGKKTNEKSNGKSSMKKGKEKSNM